MGRVRFITEVRDGPFLFVLREVVKRSNIHYETFTALVTAIHLQHVCNFSD